MSEVPSWVKKIKENLSGNSSGDIPSWAVSIKNSFRSSEQELLDRENERRKRLYEQQGVGELSQRIQEQDSPAQGFTPLGLFSGAQQTYRDLTRRKKDAEYLKQIASNSKTIAELLKRKKENPENASDYDVMLQALADKNKMLEEASGGALADTKSDLFVGTPFETSKKLVGQSLSAATDVMPFGAGVTQVGKQVLKQGGKRLVGSLAKEGATFGLVGGTGELLQKEEKVTPAQALGDLATATIIGTVSNTVIGSAFNKIGEKLTDWFSGKKVEFTPKEKDFIQENVPEMSNEELFNQAGIESPIKKTDTDLMAKSIAETDNEEVIKKLLVGKVDEKDIPTLTKTLKSVTDEDAVSGILDEYNPTKIKERLATEIATTDNEKKIASLIKGQVSEEDIPAVSRILKRVEDETEVQKILDEFKIKETPKQETLKVPTRKITKKEIKEAEMSQKIMPDEVYESQRMSEMWAEMKNAEAGQRSYDTWNETNTSQPSSFPEWIPESLRRKTTVDSVLTHLENGTYPKGSAQRELYDLVYQKALKESDTLPIDEVNKKLQTIANEDRVIETPEPTPATPTSPVEKSSVKSDTQAQKTKEDPLIAEARKYKTEDEFLNSKKPSKEYVTVYHRTDAPLETFGEGGIFSKENKNEFFVGNKKDGQISGYGKNVVKLRVKKSDLEINDEFPSGEEHYTLNTKKVDDYIKENSQLSAIYKQAHETPKTEPIKETPKTEPKKEAPKEAPKVKTKKSSLVKTLNKNAEERGLTLKKEDVPRLASKMSMDEESRKAFRVYAQDPSKAIEMAVNGTSPEGIRTGSLYTVVRDTAILENDVDTLYRLRKSKEAIEASAEAGREVKAYDSPLRSDPVKVMREIDDLKQKIADSNGVDVKAEVKTTLKELKETVEKETSGNTGFEKLINSIKC